jgi:CYTH domain-containing protein
MKVEALFHSCVHYSPVGVVIDDDLFLGTTRNGVMVRCELFFSSVERTPGEGKYARVEREQRWLLESVPSTSEVVGHIVDRYVKGTSLRLRRIEGATSSIWKFTQKIRTKNHDPERVKTTSIYLSEHEYELLVALPANIIEKRRSHVVCNDRVVAVDEFLGRHQGLVLAELELGETDSMVATSLGAVLDVTHDEKFSGGALANASDDELRTLLGGSFA